MLTKILLLVLLLLFLNVELYAQDDTICPLPPRLTVGQQARVLPGLPNRIRVRPSLHGTQLNEIPAGGVFTVLDGPVCADGYHWWSVDYKGNTGWTAEGEDTTYWLVPIVQITPTNAHQLTKLTTLGRGYLTGNVSWSPDGRTIAVSSSMGIWLYNANAPESQPRLFESSSSRGIWRVVFNEDGGRLASIDSDGTLIVWEVNYGIQRIIEKRVRVSDILFRPNGVLVASQQNKIFLWGAQGGMETFTLEEISPSRLVNGQDGKLLAVSGDFLSVWELNETPKTAVKRTALPEHEHGIRDFTISPDGRFLASIGYNDPLRIWDATTGALLTAIPDVSPARSLAFSPDGRFIAVGGYEGTVELWDLTTGDLWFTLSGHAETVENVAFSPDSKQLVSTGDFVNADVRLWDVATGRQVAVWHDGPIGSVEDITFSPNGDIFASASHQDGVRLWDVTTVAYGNPQERNPIAIFSGRYRSVAFSPQSNLLAVGGEDEAGNDCECVIGAIHLFDLATRTERALLRGYAGQVGIVMHDLAFNLDGTVLASASDEVGVWDINEALHSGLLKIADDMRVVQSNDLTVTTNAYAPEITSIAFSPNGTLLAVGSGEIVDSSDENPVVYGNRNALRLWDVATGELVMTLYHENRVTSVDFSPNGLLLATGSGHIADYRNNKPVYGEDNAVRLWDLQTGEQTAVMYNGYPISSIAFSPDSRLVAYGDYTGILYVRSVKTGTALVIKQVDSQSVNDVIFSPDGTLLVTAGSDGAIRFWAVPAN